MSRISASLCVVALLALPALAIRPASAQPAFGGPPAVGVVRVAQTPITESNEFVGRVQAVNRVNLVARVTGYLEKMLFREGSEVKQGDLLYVVERPPYESDVQAKAALVAQAQAQLQNAEINLRRARLLLHTPAGQQSTLDDATATEMSDQAQLLQAQANLRLSNINLSYTEIRAPISGKIGMTSVTEGNVVGPTSGTLATIVSQDPMYVLFPPAVRAELALRERYAAEGGFKAVKIKLRLSDGRIYGQTGEVNFIDNTISQNTDTIALRGVIANPLLAADAGGNGVLRELTDGEFVTVIVQGVHPVLALTIPRAAVLADQAGDFVYVVGAGNKAERRTVKLGQSSTTRAVIASGLHEGEMVVVDGIQRVRPGQPVSPGPASPQPSADAAHTSAGQG